MHGINYLIIFSCKDGQRRQLTKVDTTRIAQKARVLKGQCFRYSFFVKGNGVMEG